MTPRREPALYVGGASALLSLLVAIRFHGLTNDQAALIIAAITALGGVITAVATRPIAPSAFTGFVVAVAALLAGFHYNVSADVIAAVNGIVLAALALITRHQVTPVASTPAAVRGRL